MKRYYYIFLLLLTANQVLGQNVNEPCVKCNTDKAVALETNINKLTQSLVTDFLCTFDKTCANNVEYSEVSNTALFKLVDKNPTMFLTALKGLTKESKDAVINKLDSPLLDFNLQEIYDKVKAVKITSSDKDKVLNALKFGINWEKNHHE